MSESPKWNELRADAKIRSLAAAQERIARMFKEAKFDVRSHPVLADPDWTTRVLNRVASTFSLMVIGQVSAGKSSFVNALLGDRVLVPSSEPTDGVVSVLLPAESDEPARAEKVLRDGTVERFARVEDALTFLRQQKTSAAEQVRCREVRLWLHSPWLKHLRIVNTPGLGDRLQAFERATLEYLREDESDLVVWVFRPDQAANAAELGTFASALQRRRGTVLGIVSRVLENKDPEFDPRDDPKLGDVVDHLRQRLGDHLADVVLFDSHEARRLVEQRRADPRVDADPVFREALERCGYAQVQRIIEERLGTDGERVEQSRVRSLVLRCHSTAASLADAAARVRAEAERCAAVGQKELDAWKALEEKIVGPSKDRMKSEWRKFAAERTEILVGILGRAAAAAVRDEFTLLGSLGRSLASWTGVCNSAADALNAAIEQRLEEALDASGFHDGLEEAGRVLLREQLDRLASELSAVELGEKVTQVRVDASGRASGAEDAMSRAIAAALKPVVSAVLKQVAKALEKQAAKKVTQSAAQQAAKGAAARAGAAAGGAMAARAAGVITLVLIPFDIAKLVRDFGDGRERLATRVEAEYAASRAVNETQIFDAWWKVTYGSIGELLAAARASLADRDAERASALDLAQRASEAEKECRDLATSFRARAGA